MPNRINDSFVISTDNGEIDFSVDEDKITIQQLDLEPSYIFFNILKEDWEELKSYIDSKFKTK